MSDNYFTLRMDAIQKLRNSGIGNPEWEADLLLEHCFGITRLLYYTSAQKEQADPSGLPLWEQLLSRRTAHEPLQYLLNTAWFMGHTFFVSPDVLIPRPDTELLVTLAISGCSGSLHFLDICTGSGCIAVSILHELPSATALATDLSEKALAVAQKNAVTVSDRIAFRQGDFWDAVPANEKFDLICSNPPYIPHDVISSLSPEVRLEPHLALDGGSDGLDAYRILTAGAQDHLRPRGSLLLEIGIGQAASVSELLRGAGFCSIEIYKDYNNIERVIRAV